MTKKETFKVCRRKGEGKFEDTVRQAPLHQARSGSVQCSTGNMKSARVGISHPLTALPPSFLLQRAPGPPASQPSLPPNTRPDLCTISHLNLHPSV